MMQAQRVVSHEPWVAKLKQEVMSHSAAHDCDSIEFVVCCGSTPSNRMLECPVTASGKKSMKMNWEWTNWLQGTGLHRLKYALRVPDAACCVFINRLNKSPVLWIRLDPDFDWFRPVHVLQSQIMWVTQLRKDNNVIAQLQAIDGKQKHACRHVDPRDHSSHYPFAMYTQA